MLSYFTLERLDKVRGNNVVVINKRYPLGLYVLHPLVPYITGAVFPLSLLFNFEQSYLRRGYHVRWCFYAVEHNYRLPVRHRLRFERLDCCG